MNVLGASSLAMLSCILIAGLWPFHAPKNNVEWISGRNGLVFGTYGTVMSAPKPAPTFEPQSVASCSVEIWLHAASADSASTLLSFHHPDSSKHFSLHQSISDLLLETGSQRLYVDGLFKERKPLFLTLTSDVSGLQVFVNGRLEESSQRIAIPCEELTGPIVIGTSLTQDDAWQGQLLGLGFYQTALPPARVVAHYRSWTRSLRPAIGDNDRAVALYLFQEHTGDTIHSALSSGTDLCIPQRFQLLDPTFLAAPWRGFHAGWGYWSDVLINVLGFLPLGFVFCAWSNRYFRTAGAAASAAIFGCAISVIIEVLQSHLPTRHSDFTDVLTNTLGACAGAALYAWTRIGVLFRALLARLEQQNPS